MMRVAVIGAGMAGLTAARALTDAGLAPVVFDKGRGLGGRLSTRRGDGGLQFDHGAQVLSASTQGFADFLGDAERAGAACRWDYADGREGVVGLPGMSGLAKHLARSLDVRLSTEIDSVVPGNGGWRVAGEAFDRVICTVPALQALALLGERSPLEEPLRVVRMAPNLTLMVAFPEGREPPFITRADAEGDIAWLALDSAKPGRSKAECWVAQAGEEWSRTHLERGRDEIAQEMMPLVSRLVGARAQDAIYVSGHRWRFARASRPLGQPFISQDGTLFVGGDWALSDKAEGAWQSGRAMAAALLEGR